MKGTNRYVNTFFWEDGYIKKLDVDGKLVFINLLTSSMSNILGIFEITAERISYDTSIPEKKIREIINAFIKDKKMAFDDGYIIILNFYKHQKRSNTHIRTGMLNIAKSLPQNIQDKYIKYHKDEMLDVGLFNKKDEDKESLKKQKIIKKGKGIKDSHPEAYELLNAEFSKENMKLLIDPLRFISEKDKVVSLYSPTEYVRGRLMRDDLRKESLMDAFGMDVEVITDEVK